MTGLVAQKSGMSQVILDSGEAVAVTLLRAQPNVVIRLRSHDKDGYNAIQVGSGARKRYPKPLKGQLGELDAKVIKEVRVDSLEGHKQGETLDVSLFSVGDKVSVTGISKGKGFAGTVKRHGFSRGPMTHGHDHHRQPGSIGAMGMPRVHKGKRMAGRMGGKQVTTRNLIVMAVDPKNQTVALKGAVPGANRDWVLIKKHG
ncbi:50S ribosomal protein L3 [candidate division Kazan bacterium RBG_13_50_9]|uniref:Large ribosomal subunit protein uL3 n=1 Tax=candidate division Kazan bacterium RBG_13_50_9 TaxID=1798535 RepID=A0A1F4NSG7_UNCK3|nr:MAG: 50S ribosomal protein L3 [candidate division Kazan bacterium RBG_13_50_9]